MKNLIILLGLTLFASIGNGALLGVKECNYGPSYWCASIQNAKQCHAVKHCIQSVWEAQVLPVDNDDICTICKDMVKEARDQLQSNETQEELKQVFEGSCNLIPIKKVSQECIKVVDEFIPELIETLASQMNPQVVCATAGLCNSASVDRLIRKFKEDHPGVVLYQKKEKHPQPGDCKACETFINDTIRLVKTHDRSETLDRLLLICGRLGGISDGCKALVEANFQSIYDYLTTQLKASEFCDLVGMCERIYGDKKVTLKQHSGDETCDFCVAIVKHWKEVLTANTTEIEFKEILDGLCKQTGKFSHECQSIVDQYYIPLFNMLISDIKSEEICEAVGLCGLSSIFSQNVPPVWSLHDLNPKDTLPVLSQFPEVLNMRIIGQDESNAIKKEKEVVPLRRVKLNKASNVKVTSVGKKGLIESNDDQACVMCEFTLHFIQNALHDKPTREEIEEAVEKVCSLLPKTVAEECDDYVDAYGDQVIDLLSQEIDPSVICPMLGLCKKTIQIAKQVKDDTPCVFCEFAMMKIEEQIKDNKTEQNKRMNQANIKKAIENLCNVLPKSIMQDCTQFVDQYADIVIKMLADMDPDQVCKALGLCNKVTNNLQELTPNNQLPISRMFNSAPSINFDVKETKPAPIKLNQSPICILCEFIINEISEQLPNNATMDEIERVVEFICTKLPSTIQDDCIGFVEQYGDAIIQMISQDLDPHLTCQGLNLCKPSTYLSFKPKAIDVNITTCVVCEGIVDFLDEKLQSPDAAKEIDSLLENICMVLPEKVTGDCRDIIEVYGEYLIDLLKDLGHDSHKVCQAIELCPKETDTPLLGGSKCTWGPSYWCQTQLHAKSCQATAHCEEKVWLEKKPKI